MRIRLIFRLFLIDFDAQSGGVCWTTSMFASLIV